MVTAKHTGAQSSESWLKMAQGCFPAPLGILHLLILRRGPRSIVYFIFFKAQSKMQRKEKKDKRKAQQVCEVSYYVV
jgi:hypothetical protein